jgi:hypothetical protein
MSGSTTVDIIIYKNSWFSLENSLLLMSVKVTAADLSKIPAISSINFTYTSVEFMSLKTINSVQMRIQTSKYELIKQQAWELLQKLT